MKHDVFITIRGEQLVDGQREKVEMSAKGTVEEQENGYTVSYIERDGPLEGTVTQLKVSDACVEMMRVGKFASEMIMERGRRHTCTYATPYGELLLGVFASRVEHRIKDGNGKIEVAYTLDANHAPASENKLNITFKKINGEDERTCQN